MNRIILIGNGFDLAHKLETSYRHFIDDYWENFIETIGNSRTPFENDEIQFTINNTSWNFNFESKNFETLKNKIQDSGSKLLYKNYFFGHLSEKSSLKNWVDIENEYYEELVRIKNHKPFIYKGIAKTGDELDDLVEHLNNDFKRVELLLSNYLLKVNDEFESKIDNMFKIKSIIGNKIYSTINPKDLNQKGLDYLVKLIEHEYVSFKENDKKYRKNYINDVKNFLNLESEDEQNDEIKRLLIKDNHINQFNLIPKNTLMLSFNYTNTHFLYAVPQNFDIYYKRIFTKAVDIQIHGALIEGNKNPVIFGYGDELDEEYKNIERLNDNRYLENIKSIKYSETENYKRVLNFLESDYYQVFIMGHSCGTSDRTLLNTLFEHNNCTCIKVFYHDKGNGKDNFSDLVRNISRNFNDKIKMRDRLVNKSYSEPL